MEVFVSFVNNPIREHIYSVLCELVFEQDGELYSVLVQSESGGENSLPKKKENG